MKQADTVVCLLAQANGASQEVHLNELVPFFTDAWVGFALSLEITVPAFAVLLALLRVGWYRRTQQSCLIVAAPVRCRAKPLRIRS